jgi:hypothetical protein
MHATQIAWKDFITIRVLKVVHFVQHIVRLVLAKNKQIAYLVFRICICLKVLALFNAQMATLLRLINVLRVIAVVKTAMVELLLNA